MHVHSVCLQCPACNVCMRFRSLQSFQCCPNNVDGTTMVTVAALAAHIHMWKCKSLAVASPNVKYMGGRLPFECTNTERRMQRAMGTGPSLSRSLIGMRKASTQTAHSCCRCCHWPNICTCLMCVVSVIYLISGRLWRRVIWTMCHRHAMHSWPNKNLSFRFFSVCLTLHSSLSKVHTP